jgi:mono/diheme cytochrome c family protein
MSTPSSFDPSQEPARQSDEALIKQHVPEEAGGNGISTGTVLLILFAFLLAGGALYLAQFSGSYSVDSYNEESSHALVASGPKQIDMVAFGKKQYESQCITCHQATGLGTPGTYPPLAGSEWVLGSEERVVRIVLHGLSGPVRVKDIDYAGSVQMPSFGQVPNSGFNWRDEQIAAVLTYIRQAWGNTAGPISKDKVAAIRQSEQRSKPWTAPELLAITK